MSDYPNAKEIVLKFKVAGMDCGACALKIETAVSRMPGASDVSASFASETLTLKLLDGTLSPAAIEAQVRALGYSLQLVAGGVHGASRNLPPGLQDKSGGSDGWRNRKLYLTAILGGSLSVAFVVSALVPALAYWSFAAVAAAGTVAFGRRAISGAMAGSPFSIETLMSVAVVGALLIGAAEEAATVVFLFAVGELLENVAAGRARDGIAALMSVVPRAALVEADGEIKERAVEQLTIGDIVVVRPGDRIPSDGEIIEGRSDIDESPISGESVPVSKGVGDSALAGSINASASLRVRITRLASDNTIARIIHLVEEAQGSKAPTARFIDRFSEFYTPIAMLLSLLVIVIPPVIFGADWETWIYRGLATLLIACPCALVISTPAAIASGLAAGAKRGLLIKGGAALETLGRVLTIAFDKTGTLTAGSPRVTDVISAKELQLATEESVLALAAAVEQTSSHPLGKAIVQAASASGITVAETIGGSVAIPGKAVTGRVGEAMVSVGSPRFAREATSLSREFEASIQTLEEEGKTVVVVMRDGLAHGLIALRDEPRADAREGLLRLKKLGISSVMLTGDNERTARAIGLRIGIEVRAEMLPGAKLMTVNQLKAAGPIAMVGDGINDAPALAAASVGVAMGGGTDVALETADAAILKNRVEGVAQMIELSRSTLANIWQNIAIALGLKIVFLVTTLSGSTPLWMAILADTGATVLVTANALRLLRIRLE